MSVGSFFWILEEEFETHMIGLPSIIPRCLVTIAQEVAEKEDKGLREVMALGSIFISYKWEVIRTQIRQGSVYHRG